MIDAGKVIYEAETLWLSKDGPVPLEEAIGRCVVEAVNSEILRLEAKIDAVGSRLHTEPPCRCKAGNFNK